MALIACPVRGKKKSHDLIDAFVAGAPKDAEGYVFAGVKESNWHWWDSVQKLHQPFYYIDNSYFDQTRETHFRITKNRFQVKAVDATHNGKRFNALGIEIKKARERDDRLPALYVLQSELHMKLTRGDVWWTETVAKVESRAAIIRSWSANKRVQQASLKDDMDMCGRVVTHSSSAAVMALLDGIPVTVSEVSAVYGVGPPRDDFQDKRYHTMCVLADNQFTLQEMKEGLAWETVK